MQAVTLCLSLSGLVMQKLISLERFADKKREAQEKAVSACVEGPRSGASSQVTPGLLFVCM